MIIEIINLAKKEKKFILFVGSRNKYKNFQSLIKAFSASKYLNKNYKIICFGGGNFTNEEIMSFEKLSVSNKIKYYKVTILNWKIFIKKQVYMYL